MWRALPGRTIAGAEAALGEFRATTTPKEQPGDKNIHTTFAAWTAFENSRISEPSPDSKKMSAEEVLQRDADSYQEGFYRTSWANFPSNCLVQLATQCRTTLEKSDLLPASWSGPLYQESSRDHSGSRSNADLSERTNVTPFDVVNTTRNDYRDYCERLNPQLGRPDLLEDFQLLVKNG
jgi:hypothetical protein